MCGKNIISQLRRDPNSAHLGSFRGDSSTFSSRFLLAELPNRLIRSHKGAMVMARRHLNWPGKPKPLARRKPRAPGCQHINESSYVRGTCGQKGIQRELWRAETPLASI